MRKPRSRSEEIEWRAVDTFREASARKKATTSTKREWREGRNDDGGVANGDNGGLGKRREEAGRARGATARRKSCLWRTAHKDRSSVEAEFQSQVLVIRKLPG